MSTAPANAWRAPSARVWGRGFEQISEDPRIATPWCDAGLTRLRRFLATRNPGIEFFEALLGGGKQTAVEALLGFEKQVEGATEEEARVFRHVARIARAVGAIGWNLDDYTSADRVHGSGIVRIVFHITVEARQLLQQLSAATGERSGDLVTRAILRLAAEAKE